MSTDSASIKILCTSKGSNDPLSTTKLRMEMNLRCIQANGKLMLAYITYRPDILFPTIFF